MSEYLKLKQEEYDVSNNLTTFLNLASFDSSASSINSIDPASFANLTNQTNAKFIYISLLSKVINLSTINGCFGTHVKKQWDGKIKLLLWISQRNLNKSNKKHNNFITMLDKIKIGNECKQSDIDKICLFIMESCNSLFDRNKVSNTECQAKFIEEVCLEMLGGFKVSNKIILKGIEFATTGSYT